MFLSEKKIMAKLYDVSKLKKSNSKNAHSVGEHLPHCAQIYHEFEKKRHSVKGTDFIGAPAARGFQLLMSTKMSHVAFTTLNI
jgi:hypothetical protein